jgi:hypothetical protein
VADSNSSSHCLPGTFFNTCAFVDPPLGSFGNAARNSVLGPGFQIWDASIFKTFSVTERAKLEFRSEFFNLPQSHQLPALQVGPAGEQQLHSFRYRQPTVRFFDRGAAAPADSVCFEAFVLIAA